MFSKKVLTYNSHSVKINYKLKLRGLNMNYTIAGIADIHSEIGLQVFYEKNGNKYNLVMSWREKEGLSRKWFTHI